jgi:adenylylsulfate kinase-like enzyme
MYIIPMIYWFTGQPAAGKTTLAKHLISYLNNSDRIVHIDGDDLRDIFQNKDYSESGRRKNIERAQDIARFLNEKGYSVIVSLVSPYKDMRDQFKSENSVIEIYVHTTETRGRENFHVNDYNPPTENFIDIDTTNKKIEESFIELIKMIDL